MDDKGAACDCHLPFTLTPCVSSDWFTVVSSVRVESGIVADIEVDGLLPSDGDAYYQIKSQPISIR